MLGSYQATHRSARSAGSHITIFVVVWGQRPMPSISRDGIMQFPRTQLAQGKAPFTVYRYPAILSRIFLDAGVANPVKGITRSRVRNARTRFLSADEESRLLKACGSSGLKNGIRQ
ncbi:MAG TPA: hypothetical protein VLK82_20425 [Candidatus Tectomicrobia bacterium]|nr:hypothetical protein [Candidatus Tectomicrobia bacterium]